jgi:hypothetical protein
MQDCFIDLNLNDPFLFSLHFCSLQVDQGNQQDQRCLYSRSDFKTGYKLNWLVQTA